MYLNKDIDKMISIVGNDRVVIYYRQSLTSEDSSSQDAVMIKWA